MLRKEQFWVVTVVGLIALILVVANAILLTANRAAQSVVNNRQQYIQQTIQLDSLYREMAKALAELARKNNDEQLKSLLASQGITFTENRPGAPPAGGANTSRKVEQPKR
jgi:predicted PurR-regulated permease PerM